jgi:hemerythrin-like domain-containing protein
MNTTPVFERMRREHQQVLRALEVLERAAAGSRTPAAGGWPGAPALDVLALLGRQFATHMAAEDEVLFPALARALPETVPSLEPLRADHAVLRMMLSDLRHALARPADSARNEQVAVQLRDFVDLLRIHIRKEEVVVFRVAERALAPDAVAALAARMTRNSKGANQ